MLLSGRLTNKIRRVLGRRERGNAMIMALIVLSLGSLIIPPNLAYISTGVKSARIQEKLTDDLYFADAGVEWAVSRILRNEAQNQFTNPITVAGRPVSVSVTPLTSLPYGPILLGSNEHNDWLTMTESLTYVGDGVYSYSITVTSQATPVVHVAKIGAGLPNHYTYVAGSGSGAATPANSVLYVTDSAVRWEFTGSGPGLHFGESVNQTFRVSGWGTPERYYAWVQANREDIGIISDSIGYNVVSTSGNTTIEANIVEMQSWVFPLSWDIR